MSNEKMNVLIVDEDPYATTTLVKQLKNVGYNIIGTATNADKAKQLYRENNVNMVLVDVELDGHMSSLQAVEELLSLKQGVIIYVSKARDLSIFDNTKFNSVNSLYINRMNKVKLPLQYNFNRIGLEVDAPLPAEQSKEQEAISINKVPPKADDTVVDKEVVLQLEDSIFVKYNYRFIKIHLTELLYAEADNNYINLVTSTKKITIRLSLNQLLEKINYKKIVRIHRSFAVNLDAIQSFNDQYVFTEKAELPLGRNYRTDFFKRFKTS